MVDDSDVNTSELLEFEGDSGRLEYSDGAIVPVSAFRVSELEEGVRVDVTVADPRLLGEALGAQGSPRSFLGTTPDAVTVRVHGHLYLTNANVSDPQRMVATYVCLSGEVL